MARTLFSTNRKFTGSQLQNRAEIGVGSYRLYRNAGQDQHKSVNRTLPSHTVFEIQSTQLRGRGSRVFFLEKSMGVNFDELYLGNGKRHGKVV